MKTRVAKKPAPAPEEEGPKVKVILVEQPTPMVTLDDPKASVQSARGAFARLRPPESLGPIETRTWADSVRAIAKATRILPVRRSSPLAAPTRVGERPVGSIREEVSSMLTDAQDPDLEAVTIGILAEADHA